VRRPASVESLENLGRRKLSRSFYMRDFLYSEIASFHGLQNIPDDPDLAVELGSILCQSILEPLQATFGRVAIRSAYRSAAVNQFGNEQGYNCGSNEKNFAGHIWDRRDATGCKGAMACVVLPWFTAKYEDGADWRALAYWIHDNLPYSHMQFFPKLCAFNIGWHEKPRKSVHSYIKPTGNLFVGQPNESEYARYYHGFPQLVHGDA
jgi:hypothetical protein